VPTPPTRGVAFSSAQRNSPQKTVEPARAGRAGTCRQGWGRGEGGREERKEAWVAILYSFIR